MDSPLISSYSTLLTDSCPVSSMTLDTSTSNDTVDLLQVIEIGTSDEKMDNYSEMRNESANSFDYKQDQMSDDDEKSDSDDEEYEDNYWYDPLENPLPWEVINSTSKLSLCTYSRSSEITEITLLGKVTGKMVLCCMVRAPATRYFTKLLHVRQDSNVLFASESSSNTPREPRCHGDSINTI